MSKLNTDGRRFAQVGARAFRQALKKSYVKSWCCGITLRPNQEVTTLVYMMNDWIDMV